ncbi:DUF676-domain-containing protein [Rickenella mellea]|uniref:DUF676-domain-containing protein n=1 Tax=Rickenella mellea TaxID=50990 RepID=A0A4Y7Q2Y6_9AGAM|nr:DUF676-domain-containing protein [Rickenella mellea]
MGSNVHLLVLIHGMWGNPTNLAELDRIVTEVHGKREAGTDDDGETPQLEVLVAQTNRDESTYDGIDWGGERIAEEVDAKAKEIESSGRKLTKFSVTGYSLGGLLARYLVGILHQRRFFDEVQPVNFNTFATPHIGLLRYPSFISGVWARFGPTFLSRTGEQFYGVDHWSATGRSLLEVLADKDRIFYQALCLFPNIAIYANAVNDITVPYCTSGIDTYDHFANHEFNGMDIEFDPVYEPLIKHYTPGELSAPMKPKPRVFSIKWFKSFQPSRILPPFLQFRFPINLVIYALIPILVPTFIILATIRISLSARSSRARIRLMEKDESRHTKLVNIFANLERDMETAVAEMIEGRDPQAAILGADSANVSAGPSSRESTPPPSTMSSTTKSAVMESVAEGASVPGSPTNGEGKLCRKKRAPKPPPSQPLLTPRQHAMVLSLNALPRLKKHLVFIHPVRNAHAPIVCRDVKRFPAHTRGEGVVRHWADHFEL